VVDDPARALELKNLAPVAQRRSQVGHRLPRCRSLSGLTIELTAWIRPSAMSRTVTPASPVHLLPPSSRVISRRRHGGLEVAPARCRAQRATARACRSPVASRVVAIEGGCRLSRLRARARKGLKWTCPNRVVSARFPPGRRTVGFLSEVTVLDGRSARHPETHLYRAKVFTVRNGTSTERLWQVLPQPGGDDVVDGDGGRALRRRFEPGFVRKSVAHLRNAHDCGLNL
jgi:hypothetical protein